MSQAAVAGASIYGNQMEAEGKRREANAQANAMSYNAILSEQNAVLAKFQSAEEERRARIMARKQLGDMRASYGASGVTTAGSPTDVLFESAANAELDAMNIKYEGDMAAIRYQADAKLSRMNAKAVRAGADVSATATTIRSIGNLSGMMGGASSSSERATSYPSGSKSGLKRV